MQSTSHKKFAKIIGNRFNAPTDDRMINWSVLPDKKCSGVGRAIFHRWSLHGLGNIQATIDVGKESPSWVRYIQRHHDYIRCLIMSHYWLDVFNFIVHPSYPNAWELKYIPEQLSRIFMYEAVLEPSGLKDVLQTMTAVHATPTALFNTMKSEYDMLPKTVGVWTNEILKLYR